MPIHKAAYILLIIAALFAVNCGSKNDQKAVVDPIKSPSTNTNSMNSAGNSNPIATTKKPVAETSNSAPTVGPVIQAYYGALKLKDDAALRGILSTAYIAKVTGDMKSEKKSGMASYLAEYDTVPDRPVEVRNEKITGEKATAEVKGGAYIDWTGVGFIYEGGKWKISGESADITNVTTAPGANNANR